MYGNMFLGIGGTAIPISGGGQLRKTVTNEKWQGQENQQSTIVSDVGLCLAF